MICVKKFFKGFEVFEEYNFHIQKLCSTRNINICTKSILDGYLFGKKVINCFCCIFILTT